MRCRYAVLLALAASPLTAAPLDADLKTPYVWRVVVHTTPHPTLTPAFREQLCRDLKASLQQDIGEKLGTVEVIDLATVASGKREPLWTAFVESGWPALDRDDFRKLDGIKTHFVKVEVKDGKYVVGARQHDGDTGLTSPLVRTKTTPDIGKVSRAAALEVTKDFGPVATVERNPADPTKAVVRFRGGQLPGFGALVKVGDVLTFATVREQQRPTPKDAKPPKPGTAPPPPVFDRFGQPKEFTLFQIVDPGLNGEYKVRVLTRWAQPFPVAKNVLGYRAMKLTTADAPLKLRLTDDKGNAHPTDFRPQVWAGEGEFTTAPSDRESFRGGDGLYASTRRLTGLACVSVRVGTSKLQGFPVAVLGAETPTVLRFNIDEKEIAKAEFEQVCEGVSRRISDVVLTQSELFKGLAPLITAGEFKAALDRATKGLKAVTDADEELTKELGTLAANPLAKDNYPTRLLAVSGKQLKGLRGSRPDLEKRIDELKQAIARADDPVRFEREFKANELLRQVKEFLARGEVPEAVGKYTELFELTRDDDVKAKKNKLELEWAPKDADHAKARSFLLDEWRKATELADLKALAAKLPESIETFEKYEDRLGLLNLRGSVAFAGTRLKDILDVLDPANEGDAAKIADVKAADELLAGVDKKAAAALEKLTPAKK